jgi:acetoin utilization protein AcuC
MFGVFDDMVTEDVAMPGLQRRSMPSMNSVFLYTPRFNDYDFGSDHPFKPYRAKLVYELCYRYGLLDHPWIKVIDPEPAGDDILLRFHTPEYVNALRCANSGYHDFQMMTYGLGSSDNPVFKGVYDFSLLILGATMKGAELIAKGQADVAFNCNGGLHHAKPSYAEGFCYVNDIALAIDHFLDHGYERILYVDIDAHHGNGVQDAFYESDKVLFISFHQSGDTIYPGTGFEDELGVRKGYGYSVNIPLPQYTDDEAYVRAFKAVYLPLVKAYQPEIVVAQIGLDTLKRDPLTNLRCTNNGYRAVVTDIKESCPKILALGGGGYSIQDVVRGWTIAWAILNDLTPRDMYEGVISGAMYGHERAGDGLYDEPYQVSPGLKDAVNRFVDSKIDFIRTNIFPIFGAHL